GLRPLGVRWPGDRHVAGGASERADGFVAGDDRWNIGGLLVVADVSEVPAAQGLTHRGGYRLDPVLYPESGAHLAPAWRLDAARLRTLQRTGGDLPQQHP